MPKGYTRQAYNNIYIIYNKNNARTRPPAPVRPGTYNYTLYNCRLLAFGAFESNAFGAFAAFAFANIAFENTNLRFCFCLFDAFAAAPRFWSITNSYCFWGLLLGLAFAAAQSPDITNSNSFWLLAFENFSTKCLTSLRECYIIHIEKQRKRPHRRQK